MQGRKDYTMNTTHLKSFFYVAKYNNISKAALQLNYSPSTIFEQLKTLESEVGVKLYERSNSGIYLTKDGDIFLQYATKILDVMDEIQRTFGRPNEVLSITASESSDFFVMKALINKFINMYPDIEIEYSKATTDIAVEKIITNQCDIGIVSEPSFHSAKVQTDFLSTLPLSFVASPNHACIIDGTQKARENNVLLCTMSYQVVSSLLYSKGFNFSDFFSSEKNIGDLPTIMKLACDGYGIALLPTNMIAELLRSNKLCLVPELSGDFASNIYLLTAKNNTKQKPAAETFISLAKSLLSVTSAL